jgi:hypothetical protein
MPGGKFSKAAQATSTSLPIRWSRCSAIGSCAPPQSFIASNHGSACLAARARGRGPYPDLTDEEMRAGLNLMPTWALEQKAAAFSAPSIALVKA